MNQVVTPLPNPPPASDWSWPAILLISLVALMFVILAFAAMRRRSRMTTPVDVLKNRETTSRNMPMPPPLYPPV